ncbi:PQQ-binding-like beta-propeller repeat protein [Nocardiopsis gilva]
MRRPSAGVATMRRMPKGWIAPLVGFVCVVSLTACTPEDEADPAALAPSVISPNKLVTCEDADNCGEAGALRWSLPLTGNYYLYRDDDGQATVLPESEVLGNEYPTPRAVAHNGTLYYYEHERFRAVDAETGNLLWTEDIDPKRPKAVEAVQVVGDTLVVYARDNRDGDEALLYLVNPTKDSPRWQRIDIPIRVRVSLSDDDPANGTHVLLEKELDGGLKRGQYGYFLVKVPNGEVEWSADLPGLGEAYAFTDDVLYVVEEEGEDEDESERVFLIDPADGREISDFVVPDGLQAKYRLHATESGELILGSSDCPEPLDQCSGEPLSGLDAKTGELLWEHPEKAVILSLVERDGTTLVYFHDQHGYQSLDARTGAIVDDDVLGATTALIDAFGASYPWREHKPASDADRRTAPVEAYGPGVGKLAIDMGAGTRYLTSYLTEEGEVVGVYQGCAPDGMRSQRMNSPAVWQECVSPRLFTVDYGV